MGRSILIGARNKLPSRDGTLQAIAVLEVIMRDILFSCSGAMELKQSGLGPFDTLKSSGGDCIFA